MILPDLIVVKSPTNFLQLDDIFLAIVGKNTQMSKLSQCLQSKPVSSKLSPHTPCPVFNVKIYFSSAVKKITKRKL